MKRFHCVTSFYESDRVVAHITESKKAKQIPGDTKLVGRDVYMNWFESVMKAKKFIRKCKAQNKCPVELN